MNMAITLAAVILLILIFAYWYKYDYKKSDDYGYGSQYDGGYNSYSPPSYAASSNPCSNGFIPYESGNGTMYCVPNNVNSNQLGCGSGWSPSAQAEAAAFGNIGGITTDDFDGERKLDYYLTQNGGFNSTLGSRSGNSAIYSNMGSNLYNKKTGISNSGHIQSVLPSQS
jgi:hypothetical protein